MPTSSNRSDPALSAGIAALASWQRAVQADLLGREAGASRLRSQPVAESTEGRRIYRGTIERRFAATLRACFPATATALGPEVFREAVRHHAMVRPSRSFTLTHLANGFPQSIAECGSRPWVVELARYEHMIDALTDQVPNPVSPSAGLPEGASETWATARFESSQPLRFAHFGFDVCGLRKRLLQLGRITDEPAPTARVVLVHAGRKTPLTIEMSLAEGALFELLVGGEALEEALATVLGDHPAVELNAIFGWMKSWCSLGLLRFAESQSANRTTSSFPSSERSST